MNVYQNWRRKAKALPEYRQAGNHFIDPARELYKAVMIASLRQGDGQSELSGKASQAAMRQLVLKNDPEFVARLAVYMQEQMENREMAFLLSALLVLQMNNDARIVPLIDRIIQQPAFIPGWLAIYAKVYRECRGKAFHKPGRQLARGLAGVFNRLDEYQYTHYDRGMQSGFRNALIQVKPSAKDRRQQSLYNAILKDQLPARVTWKEELEAVRGQYFDNAGLKKAALKNKWEELILSWKIGYTDLLAWLPLMLRAGIGDRAIKLMALYIGNAGAVAKNGLLATRYLDTYRRVKASGAPFAAPILEALEKAAILSAGNISGFKADTRVVVAMDVSPSMTMSIGYKSPVNRFDIGPLLAMSLQYRSSRVTTGLFGNIWKPVDLAGDKLLEGLDNFRGREGEVGYAANGYMVIRELINKNRIADIIMIFTDCRLWNSRQPNQPAGTDIGQLWRQYKQMAPHARLLLFDLAAYGDIPLDILPDDVYLAAGWNEGIFGVLNAIGKNECAVGKIDFTISS